jgi:hypothetical protein
VLSDGSSFYRWLVGLASRLTFAMPLLFALADNLSKHVKNIHEGERRFQVRDLRSNYAAAAAEGERNYIYALTCPLSVSGYLQFLSSQL